MTKRMFSLSLSWISVLLKNFPPRTCFRTLSRSSCHRIPFGFLVFVDRVLLLKLRSWCWCHCHWCGRHNWYGSRHCSYLSSLTCTSRCQLLLRHQLLITWTRHRRSSTRLTARGEERLLLLSRTLDTSCFNSIPMALLNRLLLLLSRSKDFISLLVLALLFFPALSRWQIKLGILDPLPCWIKCPLTLEYP